MPGVTLPSPEAEATDPEAADSLYDSAVQWLIPQTRSGGRFPLVFQENVNYGFRRNLWGLRPIGLAVAIGCLVVNASMVVTIREAGYDVPV